MNFRQILSLTVCTTYILVSQKTEHSSDSDNVNIRPTKRQKTLVIDFDAESENRTHDARECSFLQRSGLKTTFHENEKTVQVCQG